MAVIKTQTVSEPDYGAAILEHFQALTFAQQTEVLRRLKEAYDAKAEGAMEELRKQMAEIQALTGKPAASAPHSEREASGRPRNNINKGPITHVSPNGEVYRRGVGKGTKPKWLQEELAKGRQMDDFLVSVDNPIPAHLQS